ncbi:MAG: hypothetical protein Q4B52_08250 [Tissierellia bacterium]|nr:hypothetical protein [Tissierellia bacterium]
MEKLIKIYGDKKEYIRAFCSLKSDLSSIPVFIENNRPDLQVIAKQVTSADYELTTFFKSTAGMIISPEVNFYKKSPLFCRKWVDANTKLEACSQLVIIGLDKDFTQQLLPLLRTCNQKQIEVYFLLGRDVSSLSWLIGKQFLKLNILRPRGIFSHKKLKLIAQENKDWQLFGIKRLMTESIKQTLEKQVWSELIFHGHGKEDHLNLADYTLHGFNRQLAPLTKFAPSWGHKNQAFFKDEDKAIRISNLRVEKIFLFSCSNFPFADARLYDARFNLTLDAIDGWARNIVASISVQSFEEPELAEVLANDNIADIGSRLYQSLADIQPFISIVSIGLPLNIPPKNTRLAVTARLSEQSKLILSRLANYLTSGMLSENHPIYKFATKILKDYTQLTRRGTSGLSQTDYQNFEKELINRLNPFSKRMAEIMLADQTDCLFEFDDFSIYRSTIAKDSVAYEKCDCGREGIICHYLPETNNIFELESHYCYKCGDKQVAMRGMPTVNFTCDEYDKEPLVIHYQIVVTPKYRGDIFLGVQLPTYVAQSVVSSPRLIKVRCRNLEPKIISGRIVFKKETVLQSYYLKLFMVQNGGIAINRAFFNLIAD